MEREVSGRKKTMGISAMPVRMVRSQKIQDQPAAYARAPPRIGPMVGAMVTLGFDVSEQVLFLKGLIRKVDRRDMLGISREERGGNVGDDTIADWDDTCIDISMG
jgi:hypothetical protein